MGYTLRDLVDVPRLQHLVDELDRVHGLPIVISDTGGRAVVASGHRPPDPPLDGLGVAVAVRRVAAEGVPLGEVVAGPVRVSDLDTATVSARAEVLGLDAKACVAALDRLPLVATDGLDAYVAFVADVTELLAAQGLVQRQQQETQVALAASEERTRAILDTAIDGFVLVDHDLRLVEVNDTYCRMSGYCRDELLAMRVYDLEAAESADVAASRLERIVAHGMERFESRHRRRDGSVYDVEVAVQHQPAAGAQFVVFVQDITVRKHSQVRAAQDHALLTRLARLVPGVVYQYRLWPDGRSAFPYASPGMVDIYEVTPEDVREDATPVFGRLHPEDVEKVSEDIFASARTLEPFYADFRVILPRQGLRWRWSQAVPERLDDGSTLWHGIILDSTQRKVAELEAQRLQAELVQAQKLESVGRLAGGVAHDFNNMLGVILGNAELALADIAPDDPLRDDLLEIQRAARRSADLTRQLLAFARRQPIEPRTISLNDVVPMTLAMLERIIGEDIRLAWQADPGAWPVRIDQAQLDQVLTNLCLNARDAIRGGGVITVATGNRRLDAEGAAAIPDASAGEYVCLSVADTGTGMSPETIRHIFEPFFTTKGVGEGTGLGLATAYGSVRAHGGFITVTSELGRGSRFEVWLPRDAREPVDAASTLAPERRSPGGRETILLVEDEPALLDFEARALRAQGYLVVAAAGPAEALRYVQGRGGRVDLLLTDVVMPEMSGRDLAEALLALRPGLPVIYMSGYAAETLAGRVAPGSSARLVEKPFRVDDLLAAVRAALNAP